MINYKEVLLDLFNKKNLYYNSKNTINVLLANKKIIIYGAGDGFITFSVFVLNKYGLKAHALLDIKFKSPDTFFGIPAFSPYSYKPTEDEKKNSIVVITIGKSEYHKEIFDHLHTLGFKNIILSSNIYEYHLLNTPPDLEKKGFNYFLENKEKIIEVFDLFSDDLSREIYTKVIQTHMMRKPIHIPHRPLEEQYFPKDINMRKGYSRFINCGAYNGDNLIRVNNLFGKVEAIACFEPDQENFKLLSNYLSAKHNEIAQYIIAFPCGVFSHTTQLRFAGGNKINSMILEKGESIIQCVALDDVLFGFNPTFISMDVEGAELEALKGSKLLIKENKPDLAICVYHAPNHIWEIPLYLESLQLGYKFYLRNYTSFISETVLYATT